MANTKQLRANERLKALSGSFTNLATGLVAATGARIYLAVGYDLASLLWLALSLVLYYIGYLILGLLEDESDDSDLS